MGMSTDLEGLEYLQKDFIQLPYSTKYEYAFVIQFLFSGCVETFPRWKAVAHIVTKKLFDFVTTT
jgi:hypothetical protein